MTRTRLILFLAVAALAVPVLVACSAPEPVDPDPVATTEAPADPVSLGGLDYPFGVSDEFLDGVDEAKGEFLEWNDSFSADCSAELAGSADSPECTEAMLTGLRAVNAIKTLFDFSYDNADWASGEYTGLVALAPTRDAVLAASQSGSDFIDVCYYVPGSREDCPEVAQPFLDDAAELATAASAWSR